MEDFADRTPETHVVPFAERLIMHLGIPVCFRGAGPTAPGAFKQTGHDVTIAGPDGGKCDLDAWSDPRDESWYSFRDLITRGSVNTPEYMLPVNYDFGSQWPEQQTDRG
jgi:hypothetical protein